MRQVWSFFWIAVIIVVIASFWAPETRTQAIQSITHEHALDWGMGAFCLLWLFVILKVPWDLYFKAQIANFELQRSQERGIPLVAGREAYVRSLRTKLGWLAVGMHLVSALVIAAITFFTNGPKLEHGAVGYGFAGFYLVSTLFRPLGAAYVYLTGKLSSITEEARYPREDVMEMRNRLQEQEHIMRDLSQRMDSLQTTTSEQNEQRAQEARELRQSVHAIGREFEVTVSRLTDNQELIRGIQAFVRLVAQSAQS